MSRTPAQLDCIIVGGGAAGLAAAMVLGRSRRNIAIIDANQQSNRVAPLSHSVFTRDNTSPHDLYTIAKQQVCTYPTVRHIEDLVTAITYLEDGSFYVTLEHGKPLEARTILLAQGAIYSLPKIKGIDALWGTKIWHCPYCEGYEAKDTKLIAMGSANWIDHMSVILPSWSRDISWSCIEGVLNDITTQRIANAGGVIVEKVTSLEKTKNGVLVTLESNVRIEVAEGIVETKARVRDNVSKNLDCERDDSGHIICDEHGKTSVSGVYCAGDTARVERQLNVSVASGHKTAMHINAYLAEMDRKKEGSIIL
ncbi:MAG TPA: NAD(P)/FAD-dependent oxidoreductase [Candidatus Paceibacterota bacterium]|nr:NAD(P)/FAD-dependent oxidoreductase [Candidatus Paceibacterota bacterium]